MTDHAKLIADTLRPVAPGGKVLQAEMPEVYALAAKWAARDDLGDTDAIPIKVGIPNLNAEPAWTTTARALIGTREVPGPQHNSFISKGWARLGAGWFNDDETPWCGYFVAHCIEAAGLDYPRGGLFARALEWMKWGKASQPVLGAVVVYSRSGGGHVGFLVGESASHYYVLGGNQDNMVSIAPFSKTSRKPEGFRWPASLAAGTIKLPLMSGGTVTRSEA